MSFRINSKARDWFKHIRPKMEIDFDFYYLCLMTGLAKRKKAHDIAQSDTIELTQDFPNEYRLRGHIIIALLIRAELEEMGINLKERAELNSHIIKLTDPNSATKLSNEGEHQLNNYANGGFEIMTEWFEEPPRSLEVFLTLFKINLKNTITKSSI